jgi:hypothetical protein
VNRDNKNSWFGLGSVCIDNFLCGMHPPNESRSALSAAFRMESRVWQRALVARHVNVAASTETPSIQERSAPLHSMNLSYRATARKGQ